MKLKDKLEIMIRSIFMAAITGFITYTTLQIVNNNDLNKSLAVCMTLLVYNIIFAMYYIVNTIKYK